MEAGADRRKIIILPVYNEEKCLEDLAEKLISPGSLLILADDGSTDNTGEICRKLSKKPEVRLLSWRENRGKSYGLKRAFELALALAEDGQLKDGDYIITTDGDGQLPVDVIDDACEYFRQNRLELLVGLRDFTIYPLIKRLGNAFLSCIASFLTGIRYRDTQCGFRILSVEALRRILPYYRAKGYGCEQEISIIAPLLGLKTDNGFYIKPVHYRSNSTFKDAFHITLDSFITYFRVKHKARLNADAGGGISAMALASKAVSAKKGETYP